MVKVVNIFKAAGLWVGTIFLLYGMDDVESAYTKDWGTRAAAVSRSPEGGKVLYGQATRGTSFEHGGMQMQADIGSLKTHSEPHGGGHALQKRFQSAPARPTGRA